MMILRSLFVVVVVVCLVAAQDIDPKTIEKRRTDSDFTFGNQHFNRIDDAVGFFARSRRDAFVINGKVDGERIDVHAPHNSSDVSSKVVSLIKDLLGMSKDSKDTPPTIKQGAVVNGDQINSRKRESLDALGEPASSFDRRTTFIVNEEVDGIKNYAKGEVASALEAAFDDVKNSTSY